MQNFPTVGLFDGTIRQGLEETGMGYGLEVEMIRLAREKDFLTAPYVFTVDEAVAMAEAGADVLVPHMGLTTGGTIGAESAKTLDDCIPLIQAMHDAAREVSPGADRPLPRRPDRRAGRRRLRHRPDDRDRRLLRRLLDGAAADRGRDDREHEALQGDPNRKGADVSRFVMNDEVETTTFDWGSAGMRGAPTSTGCDTYVVMDVELAPGFAHAFHKHPEQDEMIIVKQGRIVQWLGDDHRELGAGDSVHIDRDVVHGSYNDFDEPAHLQVVLAPAYGEGGYTAVDVSAEEPWSGLR